jgi:hypothetical protein
MIAKIVAVFGKLECAVNCAGVAGKHSLNLHEYPEDEWVKHDQCEISLALTIALRTK